MIKFNSVNNTNTNNITNSNLKADNCNNIATTTTTTATTKEINAVRSLSSSSSLTSSSVSDELKMKHSSSQSFTLQLHTNLNDLTFSNNNKIDLNGGSANKPIIELKPSPTTLFQNEVISLQNDVNNFLNTSNNNHSKFNFKKQRSQSEPPLVNHTSLATSRFLFDSISNRLSILNQILIDQSPTIKLLVNNIKKRKYSNNHVYYRSSSLFLRNLDKTTNENHLPNGNQSRKKSIDLLLRNEKNSKTRKFSITDLINNFSCSMLMFKRSFSYTNLKYEQKYIKKSSSFEKFLQNVVKGKQKSQSLCNFNNHATTATGTNDEKAKYLNQDASSSSQNRLNRLVNGSNHLINSKTKRENSVPKLIRSASITSNESDNLEQMMMMIMNNTNKNNWPVLRIEDSIKGSINDLESKRASQHDLHIEIKDKNNISNTSNSNNSIPDNVRSALESAGIDINQIIDLTNKLEMSFNEIDNLKKSSKLGINSDDFKDNTNESKTELVSTTSNFRAVEIKQNLCARITNNIESISNHNISNNQVVELEDDEDDVLKEKYLIQNNNIMSGNNQKEETKLDELDISKITATLTPKSVRKRTGLTKRRYATMSNFILPNSISSHTFKTICAVDDLDTINEHLNNTSNDSTIDCSENTNSPVRRFTANRLPQSPSWASDIVSSPYHASKILPAKYVPQFKPILNVHKRTSTTPVNLLVKTSPSIDSFLNPNETQNVPSPVKLLTVIDNHTSCSTPISNQMDKNSSNETKQDAEQVDLSKSLPNRNRKKNSVTRSLSYNIGNLTGSLMSSTEDASNIRPKTVLNLLTSKQNDSSTPNTGKSKTFSLIDAFSRQSKSGKLFGNSLSVKEKHTSAISKSSENNASLRSNNSSKNLTPNRISYLGVSNQSGTNTETNSFLIPGSISSSDLQCSTSSLIAFAATSTDDEGLRNLSEEFLHVS